MEEHTSMAVVMAQTAPRAADLVVGSGSYPDSDSAPDSGLGSMTSIVVF